MRRNAWKLLIAALTVAVAAACGVTYSSPPPAYPTGDFEGSRSERMRMLADRLVDRLEALREELRLTQNTRAETPVFSDLLENARRFRDHMQDGSNPHRYVRSDVEELDRLARDYDYRTRNVSASSRAVALWQRAQDVIDRMRRVSAGENVDLPPQETEPYPPYPTGPYPRGPSDGLVLTGAALDDFRRSAHELVVRATLARDAAERAGGAYSDSARRALADLSDFVSRARDLESRVSGSSVDRRAVGTDVDRLREDARRIDRSMRETSAYSGAWTDWSEVIRLLERLSDIAR